MHITRTNDILEFEICNDEIPKEPNGYNGHYYN